jgi:arylsulfatase A-like enzyme
MKWPGFVFLAPVEREEIGARENTDRAVSWLRQNGDRPFFLWVHYFDPHSHYRPPAEIAARFYRRQAGEDPLLDPAYHRAMYAAEIYFVDRQIGRLLRELEDLGLAAETVVVVVADHGESLGEHGIFYSHLGIYEQQLRIPLIVRVPGLKPSRTEALVSVLDLAPTISELTGVRLRHRCSGLSLVPLLEGEAGAAFAARTAFVHQNAHNYSVAVREGPWKLIWPVAREHALLSSRPELYHLEDDPGERVDLAAKEPGRVAALRRHLEPWIELGEVEPGTGLHLDDEALEQLRALGYLGD